MSNKFLGETSAAVTYLINHCSSKRNGNLGSRKTESCEKLPAASDLGHQAVLTLGKFTTAAPGSSLKVNGPPLSGG